MLRHRAVKARKEGIDFVEAQLAETDRTGRLGTFTAGLANWASDEHNKLTRPAMEKWAGIHHGARLPKYAGETFVIRAAREGAEVNEAAPAFGKRKAVLYATCFVNFNNTGIGAAARAVLAKNGVADRGRPSALLRHAEARAGRSRRRRRRRAPGDGGAAAAGSTRATTSIALTPSCALMLKFEWPLILPEDPDGRRGSPQATFDIAEYVVDIAKKEGLAPGLQTIEGGVSVHLACHARAQNMGAKAAEMLRLVPKTRVAVIERCSGHGGIWGARTENFETAVKVGKPAAQAAIKNDTSFVASECPLAADHLMQVMEMTAGEQTLEALARQSSHRADGAGLWTDGEAMTPRAIEVSAILPLTEYVKVRAERRRQISEIKKNRRLEVGPVRDVLFRILRDHAAPGARDALHREGRRRRRSPTSSRPTIR